MKETFEMSAACQGAVPLPLISYTGRGGL